MVIMAGMLPGVECARRRRFRQGGTLAEAAGGTRRSSFCLYATGHGARPVGVGNSGKQRTSVMELIHGWTLDSAQYPRGEGAAGPEALEPERNCHQDASQHGKHKVE